MKLFFFLSFYKMTHDPLSDHSKKKAAVEPRVKDSAVRMTEIWTGNWTGKGVGYFMEDGEWILCGT